MPRPWARRGAVAVLACTLAAGCGGHADRSRAGAPAATPSAPGLVGLPGRLVSIGAGRSLFLHCVGSGSPTVVLEAGFGAASGAWSVVQPQLGRMTRTCAYDRAGSGSSVAPRGVRDAADQLVDLQRLLGAARLRPPYVFEGHSYGGLLARLFAHTHPREVAGVVLIDAMGRDQSRRELGHWPPADASGLRRQVAAPVRDGIDLAAGELLGARVRSLRDVPLAVVTAGRHEAETGAMPRRLARGLFALWTRMQDELAALSPDHVHVVALHSDHAVQASAGQPAVVVRATQLVVRAVRERAPLPPCPQAFRGIAGVRCRR